MSIKSCGRMSMHDVFVQDVFVRDVLPTLDVGTVSIFLKLYTTYNKAVGANKGTFGYSGMMHHRRSPKRSRIQSVQFRSTTP
eukprot:1350162-Prymnesium_polylepis.2